MSAPIKFTIRLIPFLLGCLIVSMLYLVDHTMMPVMDNFTFSQIGYDKITNTIKGSGYITKQRDCEFIAFVAHGKDFDGSTVLDLKTEPDTSYASLKTGAHSFGTFTVKIPDNRQLNSIEFQAVHKCHPFWVTTTYLKEIPAPRTLYTYESLN